MVVGQNNRKIFDLASPGTATTLGSDDIDNLTWWFENVDLTAGIHAAVPKKATVATPTEYRDNRLRFLNQAQTKSLRIRTLAFANDYDLTIPLIDDNDEFQLTHHTQPVYNKTINIVDNTITSTPIAQGDLMRGDGARFVRFPIGLPGQVLTVKTTGLDFEWANPTGTGSTPSPSPPSPPPPPGGPNVPDDNTVTSAKIVDGTIQAVDIADLAISTAKIADLGITTAKMADLGVTTAKIANLGVTSGKIADGSVTTTKIVDANITNSKLVDGSITGTKLVDSTITGTKIGTSTVTNNNLFGQISNDKLLQITDTTKLPAALQYDWTNRKGGAYGLTLSNNGDGMFTGFLTPTGTHSTIINNDSGLRARWTTAATVGSQAGIRTTGAITRANNNPRLKFRINYDASATNQIIFVGFVGLTGAFPAGLDPLNVRSGIGFWMNTVDTNVKYTTNDGVGTGGFPDLAPTTTVASGGTHTFDLYTTDRGVNWHLVFDGTDNLINTNIPVVTTDMAMCVYTETRSASVKPLEIRYLQFTGDYGP